MKITQLLVTFFVVLVAVILASMLIKQTLLDVNGNPAFTIKKGIGFGSKFPVKK